MKLIDKAFDWLGTKLNLVDRFGIVLTAIIITIGAAIVAWFTIETIINYHP